MQSICEISRADNQIIRREKVSELHSSFVELRIQKIVEQILLRISLVLNNIAYYKYWIYL